MKKMIFAALVAILAVTTVSAAPATTTTTTRASLKAALEDAHKATVLVAVAAGLEGGPVAAKAATAALDAASAVSKAVEAAFPDDGGAPTGRAIAVIATAGDAMARTMALTTLSCLGREERVLATVGMAAWAMVGAQAAELSGSPRSDWLWEVALAATDLANAAERQDLKAFQAASRRLERLAK